MTQSLSKGYEVANRWGKSRKRRCQKSARGPERGVMSVSRNVGTNSTDATEERRQRDGSRGRNLAKGIYNEKERRVARNERVTLTNCIGAEENRISGRLRELCRESEHKLSVRSVTRKASSWVEKKKSIQRCFRHPATFFTTI